MSDRYDIHDVMQMLTLTETNAITCKLCGEHLINTREMIKKEVLLKWHPNYLEELSSIHEKKYDSLIHHTIECVKKYEEEFKLEIDEIQS